MMVYDQYIHNQYRKSVSCLHSERIDRRGPFLDDRRAHAHGGMLGKSWAEGVTVSTRFSDDVATFMVDTNHIH